MKTIRYSLIALITALLGFAAVPAAEAGMVKRLVGYDHCGYPVYSYVYVRDHYRSNHYARPVHRDRYVRRPAHRGYSRPAHRGYSRPAHRGYSRPVLRSRSYGNSSYVRSNRGSHRR